jgi:hypothetical protein
VMHNHRPPLRASELPPNWINLRVGEKRSAVCPDCRCWQVMRDRNMITYHKAGGKHCLGSGQRITIDLTAEQWQERLRDALRVAAARRANRAHRRVAGPSRPASGRKVIWSAAGAPPVPVPLGQLARRRVA